MSTVSEIGSCTEGLKNHERFARSFRSRGHMTHRLLQPYHRLLGWTQDEDGLHDAILRALPRLPAIKDVESYLKCIIRRRHRRVSERSNLLAVEPETPSAESEASRRESIQLIRCAVDELPERECEVVQQHDFDGLTYDKIAQRTNSSVPAVRSLRFRAHRRLSRKLMRLCMVPRE